MYEVRIANENFRSTKVTPAPRDLNDDIHYILSANGILKTAPELWESIFTDTRLRRLSLVDFQLYESDAHTIASYLREHDRLIELTFDQVLQSVFSFDHILNEGLLNNKSVQTLVLANLDNIDASTVAGLVRNNKTIKNLSLLHDDISQDGITLIADALRSNTTLVSLDLSQNDFDEETLSGFNVIIDKPPANLTQILVNNTNILHERPVLVDKTPIVDNPKRISDSGPMHEREPILPKPKQPTPNDVSTSKAKFQLLPTILVTFLFFLWGIPNQLNDVLIRQFSKAFTLTRFEAGLVQSAFYLGYFAWALPAAYVLRRWGYKAGLVTGLLLFAIGSFLFFPAALIGRYAPFLLSLFIIATGLAFLETAANPFIANAAGPPETSEKRLNIAQAFNPIGAISGVLIGTLFIFSGVELNDKEIQWLRANNSYDAYLQRETLRVVKPYMIIGAVAVLWAILIAFVPFSSQSKDRKNKEKREPEGTSRICRPIFIFSVIAQFAYVGAQVGTWSYFIQYAQDYVDVSEKTGGYLLTGTLGMFAVGRLSGALLMHCGISPSILLATFGFINVLLITISVLLPNIVGLVTLFCTSFFMSLMFPTIFALGIKGMDSNTTKLASCLLVMAIIGGAVITPLMGLIAVRTERIALSYLLPGVAYLVVSIYALWTYLSMKESPNEKTIT